MIGATIEVYVDDMMVKSHTLEDHLNDIRQVINILDKTGMKLNPEKYTFGLKARKFLGYIDSKRGIEANPEKIKAIIRHGCT